jgi:hypothetical protein
MAKKIWSKWGVHIIEKDDYKNSYPSHATNQTNDIRNEIEPTTNLLNIVGAFQTPPIIPFTTMECPSSPTPCYHEKMTHNPTILIINQE